LWRRCGRIALCLCLLLLAMLVVTTLLHFRANFCLFHMKSFRRSEVVPIVYGLIHGYRGIEEEGFVPGGCVPGFFSAVCPYCHWPAQFSGYYPEQPGVALDRRTLDGLNGHEFREVTRHATELMVSGQDDEERVLSLLVTDGDVWLGLSGEGLHRYDRKSEEWTAYDLMTRGNTIKRLWTRDGRVFAEHNVKGNFCFFLVSSTPDRGATWMPAD